MKNTVLRIVLMWLRPWTGAQVCEPLATWNKVFWHPLKHLNFSIKCKTSHPQLAYTVHDCLTLFVFLSWNKYPQSVPQVHIRLQLAPECCSCQTHCPNQAFPYKLDWGASFSQKLEPLVLTYKAISIVLLTIEFTKIQLKRRKFLQPHHRTHIEAKWSENESMGSSETN